jgi:hypothetical protein
MEAFLRRVGVNIISVFAPIAQLAAISLHLYATYLAFRVGPIPAIATFALPLISESYWFVMLTRETGWLNPLAMITYGVIGSVLVVLLGLCLLEVADLVAARVRSNRGIFQDLASRRTAIQPARRAHHH